MVLEDKALTDVISKEQMIKINEMAMDIVQEHGGDTVARNLALNATIEKFLVDTAEEKVRAVDDHIKIMKLIRTLENTPPKELTKQLQSMVMVNNEVYMKNTGNSIEALTHSESGYLAVVYRAMMESKNLQDLIKPDQLDSTLDLEVRTIMEMVQKSVDKESGKASLTKEGIGSLDKYTIIDRINKDPLTGKPKVVEATFSNTAKEVAKIHMQMTDILYSYQKAAGASTKYEHGHIRQTYNPDLYIQHGKLGFIYNMVKKADWTRMELGNYTREQRIRFAAEHWNAVVGRELAPIMQNAAQVRDRFRYKMGSIDAKLAASKEVFWNSAQDAHEMNIKYSGRDIIGNLYTEILRTVRSTEILKKLGSDPEKALSVMEQYVSKNRQSIPKHLWKSADAEVALTRKALTSLTGRGVGVDDWWTQSGEFLSNWANWLYLGKAGLTTQIMDIASSAMELSSVSGKDIFSETARISSEIATGLIDSGKNKELRNVFLVMAEETMAGMFHGLGARIGDVGIGSKMAQLQFKLSGMNLVTENNKASFRKTMAITYGQHLGIPISKMDEGMRNVLHRMGINDEEWDFMGKFASTEIDGMKVLSPTKVLEADKDKVASFLKKNPSELLKTKEDLSIRDLQAFSKMTNDQLADKYAERYIEMARRKLMVTYFDTTSRGVPMALLKDKLAYTSFDSSGMMRAFMRMTSQYRTFATAALDAVGGNMKKNKVGRDFFEGMTKFKSGEFKAGAEDMYKNKDALKPLAAFLLLGTIGAYMKDSIIQVLDGKTPQDPTNPAYFAKLMANSGGLGIYGDLAMGQASSVASVIAGPAAGVLDNPYQFVKSAVAGDAKAKSFAKMIERGLIPNHIILRPLLNYTVLNDLNETMGVMSTAKEDAKLRDKNEQWHLLWDQNYYRKKSRGGN
jgi:hypothetical protein